MEQGQVMDLSGAGPSEGQVTLRRSSPSPRIRTPSPSPGREFAVQAVPSPVRPAPPAPAPQPAAAAVIPRVPAVPIDVPPPPPPDAPFQDRTFVSFANPGKCKEPRAARSESPDPRDDFFAPAGGQPEVPQGLRPQPPFATIEDEKISTIIKLRKKAKHAGQPEPKFNMSSSIHEMRLQLRIVEDDLDAAEGVEFYEACSLIKTGLVEKINQKYDPFGMDLEGLSQHHHASVHLFKRVFERMHERYGTPSKNPLIEYAMVYIGMIWTYHLAKKCAAEMSTDQARSILKNGVPDLQSIMNDPAVRQVLQNMGAPAGGQQAGAGQPQPQPQPAGQARAGGQPQPQPQPQPRPAGGRPQMPTPSFMPAPAPVPDLTRQPSGQSAAVTEDSAAAGSGESHGIKEVDVRPRGARGKKRGRGKNVAVL